jgi:hypothetical protein
MMIIYVAMVLVFLMPIVYHRRQSRAFKRKQEFLKSQKALEVLNLSSKITILRAGKYRSGKDALGKLEEIFFGFTNFRSQPTHNIRANTQTFTEFDAAESSLISPDSPYFCFRSQNTPGIPEKSIFNSGHTETIVQSMKEFYSGRMLPNSQVELETAIMYGPSASEAANYFKTLPDSARLSDKEWDAPVADAKDLVSPVCVTMFVFSAPCLELIAKYQPKAFLQEVENYMEKLVGQVRQIFKGPGSPEVVFVMTHLDEVYSLLQSASGLADSYISVVRDSLEYSGRVFMLDCSKENLLRYATFKRQQLQGEKPNDADMKELDASVSDMIDHCMQVGKRHLQKNLDVLNRNKKRLALEIKNDSLGDFVWSLPWEFSEMWRDFKRLAFFMF